LIYFFIVAFGRVTISQGNVGILKDVCAKLNNIHWLVFWCNFALGRVIDMESFIVITISQGNVGILKDVCAKLIAISLNIHWLLGWGHWLFKGLNLFLNDLTMFVLLSFIIKGEFDIFTHMFTYHEHWDRP
jgi:hypothetical protein